MTYLNKDQILKADDQTFEVVPVPEWGGDVRIKSLSGSERDRYEGSLMKIDKSTGQPIPDMTNSRARLVALSIVDDNGGRMFADNEVLKLGTKNSKALDRVFEIAAKLSGIDPEELEKAKETFDDAQSESSTSD